MHAVRETWLGVAGLKLRVELARQPPPKTSLTQARDRASCLIVAYAIALEEHGEIASVILQRTPKYEQLLPQEERGVVVSHELYPLCSARY